MASTTFIKDTGCAGILRLVLLGILLPSVLVSGQDTTATPISTTANLTSTIIDSTTNTISIAASATQPLTTTSGSTATTQSVTSTTLGGTAMTTTTQPLTTTSGSTATTQSVTSTTLGGTAMTTTTQPLTTTSGSTATTQSVTSTTLGGTAMTTTTQSLTTTITSGATSASSTGGSTAMTQSSTTMMPSGSTSTSSSISSGPGSTSIMWTSGMSGMNGTNMSNLTSMSMIYCPSFICNYSDCYTMYKNQNATACAAGAYCQLIRQADMSYTVSCSASCAYSCFNTSQTNCSVNCCNSTGCLNGSFASMMMITTTVIAPTTTTTTPVPTTATTSPQTTANNGNKCHNGVCTGTDCYTAFKTAALQTCSSSQPHCQLKKETVDSKLQWTAGCTTNCSLQTPCKASTVPPCNLECCNATTTSCLWLNGTLNVPSFATRGPHLSTELIASLLGLLAITLLL